MTKLNKRLNLRISDNDKRMVEVLAQKMNLKEADVWRYAIKYLYDQSRTATKDESC